MQTIRDAATLLLLLMLVASIKITPLAELSEADMDWTTAEAASLETAPATEPALAALGIPATAEAAPVPAPEIRIRRLPCWKADDHVADQGESKLIVIEVDREAEPDTFVVTPCPKGLQTMLTWTFDSRS